MANPQFTQNAWHSLNFNKLAVLLLPMHWRQVRMISFLEALLSPVKKIHYDFVQNRSRNLYKVRHNWMICYLEAALNDEFDRVQRRIRIDEPELFSSRYIYTSGEHKPRYLGIRYLRTGDELYGTGLDFWVNMHGVFANIYDVRALVDLYKLAGPRYKVINLTTIETP